MSCEFARFVLWSVRNWFASNRSLHAVAALELAWLERGLDAAWPSFAAFLSIIDLGQLRDLAVEPPGGVPLIPLTADEAAVLASLTFARWSTAAARACLSDLLSPDSAEAAALAAARIRVMTATLRGEYAAAPLLFA